MRLRNALLPAAVLVAVSACSSNGTPDISKLKQGASAGDLQGGIVPSNLPADICNTPASKDLVIEDYAYNYPCDATIHQGGDAPDICVLKGTNVTIHSWPGFASPYVVQPAYAVVATNQLIVDGPIDVGAQSSSDNNGNPLYLSGPGNGYPAIPRNDTAIPLVGGAMGTAGKPDNHGGGGGGALQLVGCQQLTVTSSATINAGGGGGQAGVTVSSGSYDTGGSGASGGNGGTLLLEATQMTIAGTLAANGGGGGGGGGAGTSGLPVTCSSGTIGAKGDVSSAQAAGGSPGDNGAGGGPGGNGGASAGAPTQGGAGGNCFVPPNVYGRKAGPGGDGRSVGRIRLDVPAGSAPDTTGAVFSPAPTLGAVATQ